MLRNAGVDPTCNVGVCFQLVFPAHLGPAASAMRHTEEKEDGGQVQAQCRGK